MAKIPGFFDQAPQHDSQCASQLPQQNPDFQNDVDEMDAYINYPEPGQPTQIPQSQADNFMDNSSTAAGLGQDIPDFDNIIGGHTGHPSNDLLESLEFSSPERQVSRQVNSVSADQDISNISDSQYSPNSFLFSVSTNTNLCQPHSNVMRSGPLYETVDDVFGDATTTGHGYTSNTRTSNRRPLSQDAFDDLQNTGLRGKMLEKELMEMQVVDSANDRDGSEQTRSSEFERGA
jgi:hypothetical protein